MNGNNGLCSKQTTIAIITKGNKFWVGHNSCDEPQNECPRGDMPTGEGYELCKDICKQTTHAEVNACLAAGEEANGGILYLIGHTYCCANCKKVMAEHGIREAVIVDTFVPGAKVVTE